jgi:hypothetical protein
MQEQVKNAPDNAEEIHRRIELLEWLSDPGQSLPSISLEKKRLYDDSFYKATVSHWISVCFHLCASWNNHDAGSTARHGRGNSAS